MFSTANALPPLSALRSDRHSPRGEEPRPAALPSGECRFILLHPSVYNQRCTCQGFQHNRSPGSVCECGHQACYHVYTPPAEIHQTAPARQMVSLDSTVAALVRRVQCLEQSLEDERRARADELGRERRLRDTQVRSLQHALHPFHRKESELRLKVMRLEDRLDESHKEQLSFSGRLADLEGARKTRSPSDDADFPGVKRRKVNDEGFTYQRRTASEPRSLRLTHSNRSTAAIRITHSSDRRLRCTTTVKRDRLVDHLEESSTAYPRSSGILDTTKLPAPARAVPNLTQVSEVRPSSPRSSGILKLIGSPRLTATAPDVPFDHSSAASPPPAHPFSASGAPVSLARDSSSSNGGPSSLSTEAVIDALRGNSPYRIPDLDLYHILNMLGRTRRLVLGTPTAALATNSGGNSSSVFRVLLAEDDRAVNRNSTLTGSTDLEQLPESTFERSMNTERIVVM